jgi:hypothetical protein
MTNYYSYFDIKGPLNSNLVSIPKLSPAEFFLTVRHAHGFKFDMPVVHLLTVKLNC